MVKFLNIGIDIYAAAIDHLEGCVNDANNWYKLFNDSGFIAHSEPILNETANREFILNTIDNFIVNLSDNDLGIITYSGHGTLIENRDGSLIDEAIYAYEGKIKAKQLEAKLIKLKPNAKLVFFIDACYSENIIDTNYIEKLVRFFDKLFNISELRNNKISATKDTIRFYSDINFDKNKSRKKFINEVKNTNKHKIFLYTSCKENQKSYEREFENGETKGLFSHHAQKILSQNSYNYYTYQSFAEKLKQDMSSEIKQTPNEKLVESKKNDILFS